MVKIGVPAPSAAVIWAYGTRTLTGFTGTPRSDLVGADEAIYTRLDAKITTRASTLAEPPTTFETARVTLTAGAFSWEEGPWVQLVSATAAKVKALLVILTLASDAVEEYRVDIGTGAAGAESALIEDLTFKQREETAVYFLPVEIAAGTRVAARCSHELGDQSLECAVIFLEE